MIVKPLKLTRVCPKCQDQYGLWRERCPACGEYNERRAAAVADDRVPNVTRAPRVKRATVNACIMCRRKVKGKRVTLDGLRGRMSPQRCPHCDEPIHKECLRLHESECKEFQVTRKEMERRSV